MMARFFYTGVVVLLVFLLIPRAAWGETPPKEGPPPNSGSPSQEGSPLVEGPPLTEGTPQTQSPSGGGATTTVESPNSEGATTPVKITADEISYDYESKQLIASGAARIEYKEIKIEADRVIIDQELEMILATGRVHVVRKDEEFTGERFLYCLQTEQGWVSPMNSNLTDQQLKGPVKFTTEEAKLKGEEIDAKGVSMTGCDLAKPHYHLTAGRIEYYPGKRIVFHNVWYWEGTIRLLYLPYLLVSLEKENFEIDFGYNQLDGWWLQVGYPYEGDNYYGKITTRFTEKTPDDYGIVNNNKIQDQKYWYQKFSLKNDESLTYPSLVGLGYRDEANPRPKWLIDNIDATGQQFINPAGQFYWKKSIHFGAPGQTPYPSLTMDYLDDSDQLWSSLRTNSSWQYNPDPTLSSDLYFNWLLEQPGKYTSDQTLRNQLESLWTVRKNWGWSNLVLKYDVMRVVSGQFGHDNLLPDVTYTIPKWNSPGLGEIGITGQYTNLERFSSGQTTQNGERTALDLNKSINLLQSGAYEFNWTNKLQYRHYLTNGQASLAEDSGTDFSNFTTGIKFTDHFTKELKTDVSLDYAKGDGVVPNLFAGYDRANSGFTIHNGWNWDSKTLQISLMDDYNFNSQFLSPASFSLNWIPNDKQKLTFTTSYDWEIQNLGPTRLNLDFKPRDNWILLLALGYDFRNSLWSERKLKADITQQLSDKWRMQLKASYDILSASGDNGGFSEAVVGLIYDWHCRELNFHYDYVKSEYWLNLTFKVLPDYKFRVLDSGDLLEYYFNEF